MNLDGVIESSYAKNLKPNFSTTWHPASFCEQSGGRACTRSSVRLP